MITAQWMTDHILLLIQVGAVLAAIRLVLETLAKVLASLKLDRAAHAVMVVAHWMPAIINVYTSVISFVLGKPFVLPATPDTARPAMRPPPLPILLTLALAALSCAGSQTSVGGTVSLTPGGTWTVGVNVGISIARQTLPVAQSVIDAEPSIATSTKQQIDNAFAITDRSLSMANTAMQTYVLTPTISNQCLVHFYVDQAVTEALQAMQLAKSVGAHIDPSVTAAVGGLAAIDDMVFPGCASGPPARRVSAQERVHAALGAH